MREINEEVLAGQIPEYEPTLNTPVAEEPVESAPVVKVPVVERPVAEEPTETQGNPHMGYKLGDTLGYIADRHEKQEHAFDNTKVGRVGENIFERNEVREGWIPVDKRILGERAVFYPEDWQFRIKPANVEAIRNWSTIDDENPNSVDDVFNEILKSCLGIITPNGPLPWSLVRTWDRFFFILLIREYSMQQGESKLEFNEDCANCDNPVTFKLVSTALTYDMPDNDVMKYYSSEEQTWLIDPQEYDVEWDSPVTLYLPTLEKEANIKAWAIDKMRNNKKVDTLFIKFLPWLAPKISKDLTIASRQIREWETVYKSWPTDMFSLMDEVIKNIIVTPATKLTATCPTCGEEVTADIRFPNGIRSIFAVSSGRKKFGNK